MFELDGRRSLAPLSRNRENKFRRLLLLTYDMLLDGNALEKFPAELLATGLRGRRYSTMAMVYYG